MANGVAIFLNELKSCAEPPVIDLDTDSSNGVVPALHIQPTSATFDSTVTASLRLMVDTAVWANIQNHISRRFLSRKRVDKIKTETAGNLRKAKSLPLQRAACLRTPIQRVSANSVSLKRACSVQERASGTKHINSELSDDRIPENTQYLPLNGEETFSEPSHPNVRTAHIQPEAPKSTVQDTPYPFACSNLNDTTATLQGNLSFQNGAPVTLAFVSSSRHAPLTTNQDADPASHICSHIPTLATATILETDNELPFTADFWIWDENTRNYFHIEPDGTKSWHPTEDEFD